MSKPDKNNDPLFECVYEIRKIGSIGCWDSSGLVSIKANNVKEAMSKAFNWYHNNGFETRFPIRCNEFEENELREKMQ
jgi:hypothetical protein